MSHPMNKIDPELEGLLEEIAGQDGASLLRFDPARAREILYPEKLGVSARADLLTNAERHLLAAHRAEVGRLLYLQAGVLLTEDGVFGRCLSPSVTVDRDLELPNRSVLERRSRFAAKSLAARAPDPASELLARCCSPGAQIQPIQLLEASLRVAPSDRARVGVALCMVRDDRFEDARQQLHRVLESRPSDLVRSYAWHNIGLLECKQGRFGEAAESYGRATDSHVGRIAPLLDQFHAQLQAGQFAPTLETASRIDEMVDPQNTAARTYVRDRGKSKRLGEWSLSTSARNLLPRLRPRLGSTTNEIVRLVYS